MPKLPEKKVGIVACSGEEIAEGTVTRQAALKVLEELRPGDTVTICLPLFLAGGEGDRAFARFYPTIAVDGCELRCAARATETYSGKPAASIVVSELVAEQGLEQPQGRRRLNEAGQQAVTLTAQRLADTVDELLDRRWSRRKGQFEDGETAESPAQQRKVASCSCGSGIPVQQITVNGETVTLIALPALFEQFRNAGKEPSQDVAQELLEQVQIYNPVPAGQEIDYQTVLLREYEAFCAEEKVQ
ncbi:MAG: putative zinc-binding protein [Chloroflexota bacterium]